MPRSRGTSCTATPSFLETCRAIRQDLCRFRLSLAGFKSRRSWPHRETGFGTDRDLVLQNQQDRRRNIRINRVRRGFTHLCRRGRAPRRDCARLVPRGCTSDLGCGRRHAEAHPRVLGLLTPANRRLDDTPAGAWHQGTVLVIRALAVGLAAIIVALSGRLVAWINP